MSVQIGPYGEVHGVDKPPFEVGNLVYLNSDPDHRVPFTVTDIDYKLKDDVTVEQAVAMGKEEASEACGVFVAYFVAGELKFARLPFGAVTK